MLLCFDFNYNYSDSFCFQLRRAMHLQTTVCYTFEAIKKQKRNEKKKICDFSIRPLCAD